MKSKIKLISLTLITILILVLFWSLVVYRYETVVYPGFEGSSKVQFSSHAFFRINRITGGVYVWQKKIGKWVFYKTNE